MTCLPVVIITTEETASTHVDVLLLFLLLLLLLLSSRGSSLSRGSGGGSSSTNTYGMTERKHTHQEQQGSPADPYPRRQSRRQQSSRTRPCSQQRSRAYQGFPSIGERGEAKRTLISTFASAQIRAARETMSSCFSRVDISSKMAMLFSPTSRSEPRPDSPQPRNRLIHSRHNETY